MRTLSLKPETFILLALAATPLVFDPLAHDDAYFAPKWAWLGILAGLGVLVALVRLIRGETLRWPLRPLLAVTTLWTLWHGVAIFWAASPSLALDRFGRVCVMFALFIWMLSLPARRRSLLFAARALAFVAALTALWVLVEDALRAWWPQHVWIRPNLPDWRGFLSAGLGNTNHVGDLLVLGMLAALAMFGVARRRRWTLPLAALIALLTLALIVCYSVGSNLSLLLGSGVMIALVLRHDGPRWFLRRPLRWLLMLALWVGCVLFLVTDHPLNPHRPGILQQGFSSQRWQEGGSTRLAIWAQTLEMIRLNPLLGVGTGNFTYVFPEMDSALLEGHPELRRYQGSWTNAAHQAPLQLWAELGVLGLFLTLALVVVALHALLCELDRAPPLERLQRITLVGLWVALLAQAQMNFVLQHPTGLLCLFALIGATLLEQATRRRGPRMPPLIFEGTWYRIEAGWRSMRRPESLGLGLMLPQSAAWGLTGLLLLLTVAWGAHCLNPVRAQRHYRLAVAAGPHAALAEAHFRRALEIEPDAQDVRSRYSSWLLEQGRPAETLDQIALLRRRLNSNELFEREARALMLLGRHEEARAALDALHDRIWSLRTGRAAHPNPTP